MSPITLVAAEAYLTETRGTYTVATSITSPPRPTLIITLTTTLTRNKHKRFLLNDLFKLLMQTVLNQNHIQQREHQPLQNLFLLEALQQYSLLLRKFV